MDNNSWRHPDVWEKDDLWIPDGKKRMKPTKQDCLRIMWEWCHRNKDMIADCDLIILEQQIRTPFIIMNTVVESLYFRKTRQVSAMTIAKFFELPKTREKKKKAGVNVTGNHVVLPPGYEKLDDLADAWMMAMWGLIQNNAISKKELVFLN
jgi:hypothetical protein